MTKYYADDTPVERKIMPSLDYKVANGRIVGYVDGIDAVKQAVEKRLMTERYVYDIYSDKYGLETVDLVGKDFDYVAAELPIRIEETLHNDDRINAVTDFTISREKDAVVIGFTVDCIFGKFTTSHEVAI